MNPLDKTYAYEGVTLQGQQPAFFASQTYDEFNAYIPLALRTAKSMPSQRDDFTHAALGLFTEAGVFATQFKRCFAYDKPLDPAMRDHMREELGDLQWFVALALRCLGMDRLTPLGVQNTIDLLGYSNTMRGACANLCLLAANFAAVDAEKLADAHDQSGGAQCFPQQLSLTVYDRGHLLHALAGLVVLIDGRLAPMLGTTGRQLREDNIAKLRKRFPDAFSDLEAEARADKDGADARNS